MVLAAVAIAIALIYTRAVMVPFVLAIFISYLVSPIVDVMQVRLRLPRGISIFVAFLVVLVLMSLLVMLITVSTSGLMSSADLYREKLTGLAQSVFSMLDRLNIDLGQENLLNHLKQLPVLDMVRSTAGSVVDFLTTSLLVIIFVLYMLAGRRPEKIKEGMAAEIDTQIRRYLMTKFATSAVTGITVGVILWLFGLDLALVFGVMAFLLNFIPSIGSIISTLLPIPMAVVQFDSFWMIAGVILLPAAVQLTVGNIIEPKIMGEGLDLHPVTIILSLVGWGLLWGAVGMLLAVPMTAVLRLVLGRFEMTRPVAEMLAGRMPQLDAIQG